jgi:predicted nucleic acid-binding protein
MELYCGALNKLELQRIRKHLRAFHLCPIESEISDQATVLIERYAKSHGLLIPDALIAATALYHNYPLVTLNLKDFKYIEKLVLHA